MHQSATNLLNITRPCVLSNGYKPTHLLLVSLLSSLIVFCLFLINCELLFEAKRKKQRKKTVNYLCLFMHLKVLDVFFTRLKGLRMYFYVSFAFLCRWDEQRERGTLPGPI